MPRLCARGKNRAKKDLRVCVWSSREGGGSEVGGEGVGGDKARRRNIYVCEIVNCFWKV